MTWYAADEDDGDVRCSIIGPRQADGRRRACGKPAVALFVRNTATGRRFTRWWCPEHLAPAGLAVVDGVLVRTSPGGSS